MVECTLSVSLSSLNWHLIKLRMSLQAANAEKTVRCGRPRKSAASMTTINVSSNPLQSNFQLALPALDPTSTSDNSLCAQHLSTSSTVVTLVPIARCLASISCAACIVYLRPCAVLHRFNSTPRSPSPSASDSYTPTIQTLLPIHRFRIEVEDTQYEQERCRGSRIIHQDAFRYQQSTARFHAE